MISEPSNIANQNVARVAGFLFLCSLFVPLLNWIFVLSQFIVAEDVSATAHNILANQLLFRINIMNGLITSAIAVVLALALYIILKSVNRNFALLALFLKLIESILFAVIALGHFIALLALSEQSALTGFVPDLVDALVGRFLNGYISITAIPGVFLGLSLMIFSYLLFKSKYVPSKLAAFGVLSYILVFIYDASTILFPTYATIPIIQIIGSAPLVIFQILIGLWLLLKGINVPFNETSSSLNKASEIFGEIS